CSCRVRKFQRSDSSQIDYSLSYPAEVKLLGKPVALRPPEKNGIPDPIAAAPEAPEATEATEPTDPVQLIVLAKELAQKLGLEQLLELKALVAKMGGWAHVLETQELAREVGGWDRLKNLLTLLKF